MAITGRQSFKVFAFIGTHPTGECKGEEKRGKFQDKGLGSLGQCFDLFATPQFWLPSDARVEPSRTALIDLGFGCRLEAALANCIRENV